MRDAYWPLRTEVQTLVNRFVEMVRDKEPDVSWYGEVVTVQKRRFLRDKLTTAPGHLNGWNIPNLTTSGGGRTYFIPAMQDGGLLIPFTWFEVPAIWSRHKNVEVSESSEWISVLDPMYPPDAVKQTKIALEACLART